MTGLAKQCKLNQKISISNLPDICRGWETLICRATACIDVLNQPHGLLVSFSFQEVVDKNPKHSRLVRNVGLDVGVNVEVIPNITVQ